MPGSHSALPTIVGAAIPTTAPPAMPRELAAELADEHVPGTIQLRVDAVLDAAPPVMATLAGSATPLRHQPPAMPHERYVLGEEIARGGMGRVVEATDTVLGRAVAVKEALALDADTLKRFARETRITARLEHPSIVPVHDAGAMVGGAPFYVMRKISGRPLERLVASAETLAERLALIPHIVAAAQAVAHAHERGIVHRDIKPSNILAGELGETIVIDWGLAKVIGEADDPLVASELAAPAASETPDDSIRTRAGIVYGTPGFMAPEQLRGFPVTERCDVYALGATLYHLLSRKPPHHARTADEMMRAAASAPPPPIGELVFGVPPELSTIIDKCLAHDPRARYQNARELAEDLQRFLTGQLVASHRYSTPERLRRLVRKHKAAVAIAGTAMILLALLFVRVIGERNRADAAARTAVEQQRLAVEQGQKTQLQLERVTLQQARNEIETNPTRAIARIRDLATQHPREVRSLAIAARAAGVAWALPASKSTHTLEMSRDGRRALSTGDDGVVRLYDLAERSARTLVDMRERVSARFADEERRIVLWAGPQLTLLETATGARREIVAPTAIVDLEVVGSTAYWIDVEHRLWVLDLAGTVPLEIALPEAVHQLAPSPDGRWLALDGADHLMLYDRTQPAAEPVIVTNGNTVDVRWSEDGTYLAALVNEAALAIRIAPVPTIVHRRTVNVRRYVAYGDDRVYAIGATGVAAVPSEASHSRKPLIGDPINIVASRGNTMVAASQGGIAVLASSGDIPLSVPAGRVESLDASPHSPYVIATVEGRLLVWNLDEIQPRSIKAPQIELARFVGTGHAVATLFGERPLRWFDLATGAVTTYDQRITQARSIDGAPDGGAACLIDGSRQAVLLVPGRAPAALAGTVTQAGFASARDLLLADEAGSLAHVDLETRAQTTLVTRTAKLLGMGWSRTGPPWVAAAFADGTLWRKHLGTGQTVTATSPITPTSGMAVTADGSVLFGEGRTLRAWRPDGTLEAHAQLPQPIVALGLVGAGPLIAFTRGGTAHLIELTARDRVTEIEAVGAGRASMAADTGYYVVSSVDGIEVVDPFARHRWTLARAKGITYRDPQISRDGRSVLAHSPEALLVWSLPDPPSPAQLAGWLDGLTNAIIEPSGALGWR